MSVTVASSVDFPFFDSVIVSGERLLARRYENVAARVQIQKARAQIRHERVLDDQRDVETVRFVSSRGIVRNLEEKNEGDVKRKTPRENTRPRPHYTPFRPFRGLEASCPLGYKMPSCFRSRSVTPIAFARRCS